MKAAAKTAKTETMSSGEAERGFNCQCAACLAGGSGIVNPAYCAGCGHAYLDLRTGRDDDKRMGCHKCGAVGQFAETRPSLPDPPIRMYRVTAGRLRREHVEVFISARVRAEAVANGMKHVRDGGGIWVSGEIEIGPSFDAASLATEEEQPDAARTGGR